MKSVGSEDQEKHCMKITCPHDYRLHSWNPIMWCFVLLTLVWFTTGCPQVACWKYQDSMASRNCSTFNIQDYPNITVKRGDQEFNRSFSIAENHVLDHELFYIMCVAHYPIEWVANFPDPKDMNQPLSGTAKAAVAHLHIYRTFDNFFDRDSYRFIISTRIRYKKGTGFKHVNGTCRSIVKPLCLSRTIASLDEEVGVALSIFRNPPSQNTESAQRHQDVRWPTEERTITNEGKSNCDYQIYYGEAVDSRTSFRCKQNDGTPTSITFVHQCTNAVTCRNLYRDSRLSPGCAQHIVNNSTCVGCEERQLRLSQGMIGCESSKEEEAPGKSRRYLFFFTSIPQGHSTTKLYFSMEDADPSQMMRLSEIPPQVYLGQQLTIACNVSNYYFAGGTRLALKFIDSEALSFLKTVEVYDQFGACIVEATITVTTTSLEMVYCFAPIWNSFEWTNQSYGFHVREVISGDIIVAVSITIFLTALLVAMMFGVLWMKVGKKHGRLNLLTTSEIEEFQRGAVLDENKPIKLQYNNDLMAYGTTATYDPSFEIKRERLLLDETVVLGHGHFGLVLKGVVRSSQSETRTDVAVKTLKTKVDVGSLKALLSELKILTSIGRNNNVVNLVGACTKKMGKGEVYVAVEFCANGNLQNFLRRHRQAFRNQLENDILVIETPIRKLSTSSECLITIDLIRWAWEIAKGMEFLGSKKVIHGDLATRNILLTSDFVAKVSDFGLSRQLVDYYYVQKESGPMPWKWMALESLRDMKFSIQSDIWSFGVTLWEIFTLAESPYSGCNWSAEFVETLAAGHRLGKPKFVTSEMYELMRECWKADPNSRPSFFANRMFFEDILTQCTSQDYVQISSSTSATTDDEYHSQHLPLLHSPKLIIEEEGEDDVFEW